MSKINKISGFNEWLPEQRAIEEEFADRIRAIYRSHGFVPLETRAVEPMSILAAKGIEGKEIFAVKRAKADQDEEAELGLHFDLTVPFARYVAEHFGKLTFPFKRYQLQKVWRGERPQRGRGREFYQFDIDTIAVDELPIACDAEMVTVISKAFAAIGVGRHIIKINNRKVLKGIYQSLGLSADQQHKAIIAVDKLNKIGFDGVAKELTEVVGVARPVAEKILEVTKVRSSVADCAKTLGAIGIADPVFEQGVSELVAMLELVSPAAYEFIEIDLSMARGLDYYTGAVFETYIRGFEDIGSLCSGGRYDDLCGQFINKKMPGVGVSIGLSRVMDLVFGENLVEAKAKPKATVLVAVYSEGQRAKCNEVAEQIRSAGLSCEVYFKSPKLGKQIDYASACNIPYVLFVGEADGLVEVKDLRTKEQVVVKDLAAWANSNSVVG